MDEFEQLLTRERAVLERYVRFRLRDSADTDDLIQEICLTAYRKFHQLQRREAFRPWLLTIARNRCADHFRRKNANPECSLEELPELADSRHGPMPDSPVLETMELLREQDRQILDLFFWQELQQAEIAMRLGIPVGTVKSRLHTAKQHFKDRYPYPKANPKGASHMKKLPEFLPAYTIEANPIPPFSVKWEELMGWFLVPKEGEQLSWGIYDIPSRKCSHIFHMRVTGKAKVHGIEGVELTAKETALDGSPVIHRTFVAQLTDTHCRYLATLRHDGDVKNYITFLDGEEFLPNWGYGENNCGNETNLSPKGLIHRTGNRIQTERHPWLLDITGRYTVTIGGRSFDTVCVMDIETYNCGVVGEQFLDASGRTVLWRRFNRDDWALEQYGKPWSELLPENERLEVNGVTYVHWYDCITEHIL